MTAKEIVKARKQRKQKRIESVVAEITKRGIRKNPKKFEFQLQKLERIENETKELIIKKLSESFKADKRNAEKFLKELETGSHEYDFYLKEWFASFLWDNDLKLFAKLEELAYEAIEN